MKFHGALRVWLLGGLLVLCPFAKARTCSCFQDTSSTRDALDRYDAVFLGQILEITLRSAGPRPDASGEEQVEGFDVVAKVLESWKGTSESRVVVHTGPVGGMCGYPFQAGQSFLIWASRSEDGLTTQLCDRTTQMDSIAAATDLDHLRQSAEVQRWPVITAAGFTLRLPKGFGPGPAEIDAADMPGGLHTWGVPLKPPRVGGWSRGEEHITYEVVGYDAQAGKPVGESEVAGHRATMVHQAFADERTIISVHWPDVLRERGDAQGASPGGLTLRCLSGRGPAANRDNICDRVFESVEFIGDPR